jgi:hypothetical protein
MLLSLVVTPVVYFRLTRRVPVRELAEEVA